MNKSININIFLFFMKSHVVQNKNYLVVCLYIVSKGSLNISFAKIQSKTHITSLIRDRVELLDFH